MKSAASAGVLTAAGWFALAGCAGGMSGGNMDMMEGATTFTVSVSNVSQPGTLATDRAMGAVPLSPAVYAVFSGANPMFTVGQPADGGTELLAEDGFPMMKQEMLAGMPGVTAQGIAAQPMGQSPAIEPGETATFEIMAMPGQRLQLETMFVQSNDWFYALGADGIALFDGNTPISGDVTGKVVLYDAGTEEDTAPGTGPDQKPAQDAMARDVGPADDNDRIRPASEAGFTVPPNTAVIRVTITPAS
jgi:hypothetical protein